MCLPGDMLLPENKTCHDAKDAAREERLVSVMYGAILGDIIGSVFEFDRGGKTKEFPLFCGESTWTDDTVMTVAVADALMDYATDEPYFKVSMTEKILRCIEETCVEKMQAWGRKYPYAGYGGRFIRWLGTENPKPYKSFGNGSAMRVSAAGWLFPTMEMTRLVASVTAQVSHNHPEGIKGAECTAAVIFLARLGKTKEYIADYVVREFGYDFSETLAEMRTRHEHVETCMDSLPKAMRAFLEGNSYEDVVRNAVSLGGDTDTLGAIAGAMAEAYYGVPEELKKVCLERVPKDMRAVLKRFEKKVVDVDKLQDVEPVQPERAKIQNEPLMQAYELMLRCQYDDELNQKAHLNFACVLAAQMAKEATLQVPYEDVEGVFAKSIEDVPLKVGGQFSLKDDARLRMDKMVDKDGKFWVPLFLSEEDMAKGETANIIFELPIRDIVRAAMEYDAYEGLVVNPFGPALPMPKEILRVVWQLMENMLKNAGEEVEENDENQ